MVRAEGGGGSVLRCGSHDERSPFGGRGQDAMIADHVEAGRGDERGEFRDQFQRVEDDVGGSIRPGALEAVGEPGVERLRETFDGQGRPGGIAADPFQSRAVGGGDGDVGVEAEAGYGGARGSGQELARLLIDPDSGDRDPSSRVGTGGDAARDGGAVEGRQPRLKVGEGIDLVGIGIGTQAAALEQGRDPTRHASGKPGDLGVIGWRQRMEAGMPGGIGGIDAVERQHVKMHVQIQAAAETLDKRDGAALPFPNPVLLPSPASRRAEHGAREDLEDIPDQGLVVSQAVA